MGQESSLLFCLIFSSAAWVKLVSLPGKAGEGMGNDEGHNVGRA